MGKGRPRAVERGVLGHGYAGATSHPVSGGGAATVPPAPIFYPTDEDFKDPLEYINKIRPQAEPYGICRIVPPKSWSPPFARDLRTFTFPTKTQAIHRLQARPPSCDSATFDLEYTRFLGGRLGKKGKKKLIFDGEELDLCQFFNAVKRYGGYAKVCGQKRWGDVASFMGPGRKISECSKHVLCQMYREHLFDYEEYSSKLSFENRKCRGREHEKGKSVGRKRRKLGCFEEIDVVMKEEGVLDLDQICEQCRSGLHGDVMLLCDRCDKGWHLYCLSPPLDRVPSGNWYCLECVNSDKDSFGFVPGKEFSLEDFKRVNDRIRRRWFGQGKPSKFQIEKLFWEIVEGKTGELEVVYGSDLDTSVHGSGFPRSGDPVLPTIEVDVWKKYESSPWNLNNLPKLQSSMLRVIHDNIAGVMVPWMYVGMLFSSFCWHVEDHCFYSINYLHWGEPKCWYGVPGRKASAFEQVMRSTLPDLFDAQPDLLFQLVTMLNPAILQESRIPVYNVMQEPGNFVVTFPKSFHAGFNFGLNCAEAVNFAPADWLPHGRFGAELYRLYRKPAVFSHEELLCVVAKNVNDSKALPYLKDELCRICISEKNNREEVWKNGIVKSSLMTMKKHPLYVGTEEDHTCIICRQYLYLSAISCSCRTTTFVCLKHWKHLCECDSSHHQLLYRHSLAELDDLITMTSSTSHVPCLGTPQHLRSQQSTLSPQLSVTKLKKVKGGQVTLSELAEDWNLKASNLFEIPFSNDDFAAIMSEAEQFLWAGHDMDKVRNVAAKLIDAQKWALSVKDCLFRVDTFSYSEKDGIDKISLNQIEELLNIDPVPCYEPGHLKLEAYADDAKKLIAEIRTALSSRLDIGKMEIILSKAMEFPVDIEETKILKTELSSAKIWMSNVREFFKETSTAIDIGFLNSLKLEMLELRIQLQEMDLLANFSREVDLLHFRCKEILKRPLKLKFTELDNFLKDADKVRVSIPELELLKDFHLDACSWSRDFHDIMNNLPDREDYENIVVELSGILESGNLLRIEVDELQLVEAELQRSRCREKATKALQHRMPFEFIEEVLVEASLLEIKNENCFFKLAKVESEAILWEKRASYVLTNGGSLSEFKDILRASEHVLAFLPSLSELKDAISMAQAWISRSQPYLIDSRHTDDGSCPLLSIEDLKELVKVSRNLKVNLDGPERLEKNLNAIYEWEHNTCLLEEDTMTLFKEACSNFTTVNNLILRVVDLLTRANSAIKIGISMYVALGELPKLQQATLTLQWSLDALSFCTRTPLDKDIDNLLEDAHHLPIMFSGCSLVQMLVNGANLLRKGLLTLSGPQNSKRCLLKEVDEVLGEIQKSVIPYPSMVARLQNAIEKHNSWTLNVHKFFSQLSKKCWASLVELEEQGQSHAFDCPELAMVASEVGKVKKWMLQCHACVEPLIGNTGTLSMELIKIKDSLHKALSIYRSLNGSWTKTFCLCCSNDSESDCTYRCISCGNRYHFSCTSPRCTSNNYSCSFCISMETEAGVQNGEKALVFQGNRPEFRSFAELVSSAERLYPGIQEVTLLQEIVELAEECRFQLYVVVDHSNSHYKDFNAVTKNLVCALKATSIAGLYDYEGGCNLQIALSRHSWKVRVKMLMSGVKKATLQAIQHIEKEGLQMGIPYEDQLMLELTQLKQTSLQWLDVAKKVASDSGEIPLSRVFELMNEGELLPVKFDAEMTLLKNRSILYCICRKPDDQRPMIACDQCDEWYHFHCLNLREEPRKTFFCPACKPFNGELISLPHPAYHDERSCGSEGEPQTPACHESKRREQPGTVDSCLEGNAVDAVEEGDFLKCCSEIDYFWRVRRRPLQRASKKHSNLGNLSQLLPFLACSQTS